MLLDYAATYPNSVICCKYGDMVLHLDSDVVYLTMPEERSCYYGNFYISDWTSPRPVKPTPKRNSPIHTECKTIRNMLYLAAEDETCGTLNNKKKTIDLRPALITLDHKQPATLLKTENLATEGFVNLGMKPKRSKTWDIKWHWFRDK